MRETSEKVGGNIVGEWLLVKAEAQIGGGEERKVKTKKQKRILPTSKSLLTA